LCNTIVTIKSVLIETTTTKCSAPQSIASIVCPLANQNNHKHCSMNRHWQHLKRKEIELFIMEPKQTLNETKQAFDQKSIYLMFSIVNTIN